MLDNRNIVITGASRGIGASTARLCAQHGARVAVNYMASQAAAEAIVTEITDAGGTAVAIGADVRDEEQVARMAEEAEKALGPIDSLVINASISFPMLPFMEYPWADFAAKVTGEMQAAFHCARAFVPGMLERKQGNIVAVSSGLSKQAGFGFCAHSTAKAALNALVRSMALELSPSGIRVNTVSPGLTITDATSHVPDEQKKMISGMTPLRRNGLPEDIAGVILMMLSEETRFVTGGYIPVDGGMTML
ncbi:SDR family oxidoreductase [candidate division GN15 bacterium]|nr:SDR family oxidoreductase [candidate division GN15 bacterium]